MPDSNRLDELRRQRALVAEQLAWIDREIATAAGAPTPPPATPAPAPTTLSAPATTPGLRLVTPTPRPVAAVAPVVAQAALADADKLLDEYRVAPDTLKTDVKKGCFLYFFGALALVGLGVVALYFIFRAGK